MARSRRRGHRQSLSELVQLWVRLFREHNLLTYASAIAFQALIAGVALVLLGLAILGEVGRQDVWTKQIGPAIEPKILPAVYSGINATVHKIFTSSSGGLIAFAAAVTIWEMSGVVRAIMGAIARVYDTEDTRSWKVRLPLSIGLGLALTVSIVGAILLATAGRNAVQGGWAIPFAIARWLLTIVLIGIGFGLLVRFAPVEPRTTRWASGGTSLVVLIWVVQSLIFAVYLRTLANYRTSVGSLLGVYFLTTFLNVAAIILLVGIELDEQLRKDIEEGQERGILEIVRDVF
jgi:membrane protein